MSKPYWPSQVIDGMVAGFLENCIEAKVAQENSAFNSAVMIMRLSPADQELLFRELQKRAKAVRKKSGLPERMVDWRKEIEG